MRGRSLRVIGLGNVRPEVGVQVLGQGWEVQGVLGGERSEIFALEG